MDKKRTSRLFFALWPARETRARLAKIQQAFSERTGRFNHPRDLHITLVFLGPVEEQRIGCIMDAADRIALTPFSLVIDRYTTWKRPRILWCGPSTTPAPLARLVSDLETALAGCGFEPEKRRYTPHVTLARKIVSQEADERLTAALHWPVDSFVLAGSGGQAAGPRYRILKKWPADS